MRNIKSIIRSNVLQMSAYRSARDDQHAADSIFLDANENPFNWEYARYPDPKQQALRSEIARWRKLNLNQIMIGNGSDEIIDLLIRACCHPQKDAIRILDPSYGMYQVAAMLNDVQLIKTSLNPSFELESDPIKFASNEKIFFICSPNNPTGNTISHKEIEKVLVRFPGLVVVDEAYIDFSSNDSWLDQLSKYENLVVLQTFSKSLACANLRVGMCFGNPSLIEILFKIKPPYNVSGLVQEEAIKRLKRWPEIEDNLRVIKRNKEILKAQLEQTKAINMVFLSDGNFLLAKASHTKKLWQHLKNHGIIVRDRSQEKHCDHCLRITVGTEQENNFLIQTIQSFNPDK